MTRVDLLALLRARNLRVTPQRRAIVGVFTHGPDEHLSADEVHARAAQAVPELGRGTVYATLAELVELGILGSVGNPEPMRYESNVAEHDHLRCDACLRLFDVELEVPDLDPVERAGHEPSRARVVVEGRCAECRDYEQGLQDGAIATASGASLPEDLVGRLGVHLHDSPLGPLAVAASADGIVRVAFEDHADYGALEQRAGRRTGGRAARERIAHAEDAIDAYFGGSEAAAEDIVDWSPGVVANHGVLEATRHIPYAGRRSYVDVCDSASPYDCGYAMGVNPAPVLLPCHRVSLGQLRLDDYVGGQARRDKLDHLEHP